MKMKIIKTIASVAVLAFASNSAFAAGTAANTPINNTASISYNVGGTGQTDIYSSPTGNSTPGVPGSGGGAPTVAETQTTFVVDKKIDLLVTAGSGVSVAPGATSQAITFTVVNEGNSTEDFTLATTGTVAGDNFDTSACTITAPASLPVSLGPDASQLVTVECDIPASSGTVVDGATSLVDLLATVTGVTATATADDAAAMDTVFADSEGTLTDGSGGSGERNASHSATNTYTVNGATLIVTKTEAVSEMSIDTNGDGILDTPATGNLYHIPGAEITYTITVSNADGAADATDLVISDPLSGNLTFQSCAVTGPVAAVTCGNSVLAGTAGGTVTTSAFTLPGGTGSANVQTLTITATVN